jgi:hypothetical protein
MILRGSHCNMVGRGGSIMTKLLLEVTVLSCAAFEVPVSDIHGRDD